MKDKLAKATAKPDVSELVAEYRRALDEGSTLQRIREAENIRFTKWAGQSDDGKKWAKNLGENGAFPFDGASDTRIPLADQIINDTVDILATSHSRAQLRVGGTETNDGESSAAATTLVNWARNRLHNDLIREVELLANYRETYGWACAFVGWDQQSTLRTQRLTMDEVIAVASQSEEDSVLADLPTMVSDPAQEDQVAELLMSQVPGMKKRRAVKVVKQLRETGEAEFPVPYICKNEPTVVALKPYEEVCFDPSTIDLQKARVIFRRQYMTHVDLQSKVTNEGWDKRFVEEALNTAGQQMNILESDLFSTPTTNSVLDRRDHLVEVIWAYTRQLNEDGVPAIYCTVFCPLLGDPGKYGDDPLYGKHFMLPYAHNQYPFVAFKRENVVRRVVESRGVSEICRTWQTEIKAQRDSIYDSTSFETLPALMVSKRLGMANKIGPGVQLPVTKSDDYKFLQPPSRPPNTAFQLVEHIQLQADEYFGRANAAIPPVQTQLKQQRIVNDWLRSWTEIYRQMFSLCIQYYGMDELARITSAQAAEAISHDADRFDFVLKFTVAELDNDLVKERLGTIANAIVPLDVMGRIDRAKLVDKVLRSVAPESADELIVDEASASQQMYGAVKQEIVAMLNGIEATYQDMSNDASAGIKLQFAQEIAGSSPGVQEALQSDQMFGEMFKRYIQNLEHGVVQQQNKMVGRQGVQPISQGGGQ
tara:strand:- start:129 stop:2249 length:2121 start_codon:yes stop_codon:yes gene_type:complete